MKECDKRRSHISTKLHMIYISSNNVRHPVTRTFTPLHYTCRQSLLLVYTSPNYTSLHFTTLVDNHYFSFTLHPTTLHSTSLHLSTLRFLSFKLHPPTLLRVQTSCAVTTVPSQLYCVPMTWDNCGGLAIAVYIVILASVSRTGNFTFRPTYPILAWDSSRIKQFMKKLRSVDALNSLTKSIINNN
jgi:hypothetical protein